MIVQRSGLVGSATTFAPSARIWAFIASGAAAVVNTTHSSPATAA